MNRISEEELTTRLNRDFGYPQIHAPTVADKILALRDDIYVAFEKWWQTGESAILEREGFTFESLLRDYKLAPVAAFLTLDWLSREPEQAAAAIRAGYDRVSVQPKLQRHSSWR